MKVAVTYEDNKIFGHFGHTEQFKIYEIENKEVKKTNIVKTNGQGHGALANFLKQNNVNVLICGGIGSGAINALTDASIEIYGGIEGNADEAVSNLINGNLTKKTDVKCNHHHEEEHECSGSCNKNGCEGNK